MTVEDFESSCHIRVKDMRYFEDRSDINDEITVFESPIKSRSNRLYKSSEGLQKALKGSHLKSPVRRLFSISGEGSLTVQCKNVGSHKNTEEIANSELSTPSSFPLCKRERTYSSNFSPVSVNLVDSVRKSSLIGYSKTDGSPRH
jgi:hypothetical protein